MKKIPKTREQIRNERAEAVCRELRHIIASGHWYMTTHLARLVQKWADVTGKIKYERPVKDARQIQHDR